MHAATLLPALEPRPAGVRPAASASPAARVVPFRPAATSRPHASAPWRQQQLADGAVGGAAAWRRQQRQQRFVARAEPMQPGDWEKNMARKKERFDAINKDYAVLTQQIEETSAEVVEGLQGTSLFLVGMMGSGKSTVGKLVAKALGYCFFDTDTLIEQVAQKKVADIFAEDGEQDFRELETQVLAELSPFKNCVVATGGGVPTRAENWGHMQGGVTVWLNGPPELLAHRVVGDGTASRPLLSQSGEEGEGQQQQQQQPEDAYQAAVARLAALLEERRPLYQGADITVSLEGTGPDADIGAPGMEVCYRILAAIDQRIKADAEERKRRMEFEIVQDELPSTMRVMESPAAAAKAQAEQEDPFLP